MKVLKMHSDQEQQFDQFVHEQLDSVEVDTALAKHYFGQMKLPSAIEPLVPPVTSGSRRRWFLLVLACCAVAVTGYILLRNNKDGRTVQQEQPASAPVPLPGTAVEEEGEQLPGKTTDTAASEKKHQAPLPGRVPVQDEASGSFNNSGAGEAVSTDTAPAPDSIGNQLLPIANQLPAAAAGNNKKDTASQKIQPKLSIPEKRTDSVYIIW